ncbi:MAG: peptidoglycan editing factor PgeF [Anaerolineae bacterium]
MRRNEKTRLAYYTFDHLTELGIKHAVATRLGGVSRQPFATLNIGNTVGDSPASVAENLDRLHVALDLDPGSTVTAEQIHGSRVTSVGRSGWGAAVPSSDALVTDESGTTLLLRFADCVPLFLVDAETGAVGLGHAGWRGTAARLAGRLVEAMVSLYRSDPAHLWAGLGPGIAAHHYAVSDEIASRVAPALPDPNRALIRSNGAVHLDLWEANRQQLLAEGVAETELMPLCTACQSHEFFSHRGEGPTTGRFAALLSRGAAPC